jgi:hypothetical protein
MAHVLTGLQRPDAAADHDDVAVVLAPRPAHLRRAGNQTVSRQARSVCGRLRITNRKHGFRFRYFSPDGGTTDVVSLGRWANEIVPTVREATAGSAQSIHTHVQHHPS